MVQASVRAWLPPGLSQPERVRFQRLNLGPVLLRRKAERMNILTGVGPSRGRLLLVTSKMQSAAVQSE